MKNSKKIIFLTGTRADFGKLKSLISIIQKDKSFEVFLFVTGMHMLSKYGNTYVEIEKSGFHNIHKFVNQNEGDSMDRILSKTINGFSDYVSKISPDFIVIHGDRIEAMAGAIVGSLNNILTGHVEGGEVSGTIDEIIRHSVSKLSNTHFVANKEAKKRLLQLGEKESCVHIIGSPDIDIMNSSNLPSLNEVKKRYDIFFDKYAIIIYHSVTTELNDIKRQVNDLVEKVIDSTLNFVVIYPNNDPGSEIILEDYKKFDDNNRFKIFPSMRFEYFLTLLKNSMFIIGNSSAGIREAPHFGVPSIDIGTRQNGRVKCDSIINIDVDSGDILSGINFAINYNKSKKNFKIIIINH